MTLIAIEEHWMLPELAAALATFSDGRRDDSLSFNDMHDNRQGFEDFGASRIEFMDGLGIDTALLHHALSVTTPERLIFSTDYPFGRPSRDELDTLLQHFETDADREKFCSGNAASLFDL